MDLVLLLAELRELTGALDADDLVSPDRLRAAANGAREVAPSLKQEEGQQLAQSVAELSKSVAAHRDRMGEKLRSLGQSRRALRAYGHLRSHKQGQQVVTKA